MAAVFLFRAAIALGLAGTRVLTSSQGPAAGKETGFGDAIWSFLGNADNHDFAALYAQSQLSGYTLDIADYVDPFELRLLQVHIARDSGEAGGTDDAVVTHHFIKLAGAAPTAWDDSTDLAAMEAIVAPFYASLGSKWPDIQHADEFRWYRAGPAVVAPNPPIRVTPLTQASTGDGDPVLPPQNAMSVTEKVSDPKSWGRFYIPCGGATDWVDLHGRFQAATITAVGGYLETMIGALNGNHTPLVVYSPAKPIRPTKGGGTLPAIGARALGIMSFQIDDVVDVQRRRRWDVPLIRQVEAA